MTREELVMNYTCVHRSSLCIKMDGLYNLVPNILHVVLSPTVDVQCSTTP